MILDGFGLQGAYCTLLGRLTEVMVLGIIRPPGQIKLKQSSVIVIGAGGLGCPALQYLAATGIGELNALRYCLPDPVDFTK
jgi:molybdopterin/thiamine biosynthesis adenylyltransferase